MEPPPPDIEVVNQPTAPSNFHTGIRAHIDCPQFTFPSANKRHIVITTIPFKAEPWSADLAKAVGEDSAKQPADGLSHSWLQYHDDQYGDVKAEIDGWKMTWEVSLRATGLDIQASETKFQAIDSAKFTAASIFCFFEESKVPDTFSVVGKDGEPASNVVQATMAARVSKDFDALHKASQGLPSADSPYVLGYGISAKPPTLEEVNANLKLPTATPTYFIPRRLCRPSVYQRDIELRHVTYRDKESDQVTLEDSDTPKGMFQRPFFSTILTPSTGTTGGDGVMAFSKQAFILWLTSLLGDLGKADPTPKIQEKIPHDSGYTTSWTLGEIKPLASTDGNGVRRDSTFEVSGRNDSWYKPDERTDVRGGSTVAVRYRSDLKNHSKTASNATAQRRVLFDFFFYYWMDVVFKKESVLSSKSKAPTTG
ncbi:hypothetical protein H2203_009289 [Taxawa tesnikishii (nom. ined.)]|nr:hypothetical protein H2203_009289 [Dothideales sp. JES 119]